MGTGQLGKKKKTEILFTQTALHVLHLTESKRGLRWVVSEADWPMNASLDGAGIALKS